MVREVTQTLTLILVGTMTGGLTFPLVFATMLRRLGHEETRGARALVYILAGWVWFAAMAFILLVLPWSSAR